MIRVCTKQGREGQRMRRKKQRSVLSKSHNLWIITLKIETTLSKLMEVACKVVLPCTSHPIFTLWNMFICNSNLGVWVASSYIFKQSLFIWLYAWWPFGPRKTGRCTLKSKWLHTYTHRHGHTDTYPFHSTLPHVAPPAYLSLFLSLRKGHKNIGMLLWETNAVTYSIMHILKIHVRAASHAYTVQTYPAMWEHFRKIITIHHVLCPPHHLRMKVFNTNAAKWVLCWFMLIGSIHAVILYC